MLFSARFLTISGNCWKIFGKHVQENMYKTQLFPKAFTLTTRYATRRRKSCSLSNSDDKNRRSSTITSSKTNCFHTSSVTAKEFIHRSLWFNEKVLGLRTPDGNSTQFHFIWLRDHCKCSECYHPVTNQRQIDTFKIPLNIKPKRVSIEDETLKIIWHDGHVSCYETSWLNQNQYGQSYECYDISDIDKILWNGAGATKFPQDAVFSEILEDDKKLLQCLENIVKYGIVFISDIPRPFSENLRLLGNRIGLILNTFYGDVWSFTSGTVDYADTAYMPIKLECHNDGTYFFESPGLQLLHCDSHEGVGGENIFVDGFSVARELQKDYPEAFSFLSNTKIPSVYYERKEFLFKAFDRVLKLDDFTKSVYQIRFNSSDRDVLSCLSFDDVERFYDSSHKLTKLIREPSNELSVKIRPGRAAIFDNWRVFHARNTFTGTRSMTGFYVRKGDFLSKIKSLRLKIF